jgi:hypothetical protein
MPADLARHALQLAFGPVRGPHAGALCVAEVRDATLGARLELAHGAAAHAAHRHDIAPAGEGLELLRGSHMPEPSRDVELVHCVTWRAPEKQQTARQA